MDTRKRRKDRSASPPLGPIAGNGLLDRRALLGREASLLPARPPPAWVRRSPLLLPSP